MDTHNSKSGIPSCTSEPADVKIIEGLVHQWYNYFNSHDADAIERMYALGAVADDPQFERPKHGPKDIAENYRGLFQMAPDVKDDLKSISIVGSKAFVEFEAHGTIKSVGPNDPPAMVGKTFRIRMLGIMQFEGGRIVSDTVYYDQYSFMKQVGLLPLDFKQ